MRNLLGPPNQADLHIALIQTSSVGRKLGPMYEGAGPSPGR